MKLGKVTNNSRPSSLNSRRFIIGLTGGIASGKTTVLSLLAKAGISTIAADDVAHDCILKGKPGYRKILRTFGRDILGKNQEIDRKALGKIVFADPLARRKLEKIIHPCVAKELKRYIQKHQGVMALDIPLLFEAGYASWMDAIVVVYATPPQQLKRLMQRNRLNRREAKLRLAAQMPLDQKCRRANLILDNSHSPDVLRRQVRTFLAELQRD